MDLDIRIFIKLWGPQVNRPNGLMPSLEKSRNSMIRIRTLSHLIIGPTLRPADCPIGFFAEVGHMFPITNHNSGSIIVFLGTSVNQDFIENLTATIRIRFAPLFLRRIGQYSLEMMEF